ncbi:MAG: hypothetical protein HUJ58_05625 [Erysipelotrichaceae bacterium]|nr:hypothetical protein [Erysipelotrichaceae bacterium]
MKQDEFSPLPEEICRNTDDMVTPGSEFTSPAPEFGAKAVYSPKNARKKRMMALIATVLFLMVVFPQESTVIEPQKKPADPIVTEPIVTEPIEQDPLQPPTCQAVFFAFSDSLRAKLVFTNPDKILSVSAELWDAAGDAPEQSWDVPLEDIRKGEYILPDMMGIFDMYMAHHKTYNPDDTFPVPQLRVSMKYLDKETEAVAEFTKEVTEEQGWSARAKDGEIRFGTYESYEPISVRVGTADYASEILTLKDGEILVVVYMNGILVDADQCTVSEEQLVLPNVNGEDITFHYANVSVPQQGETGKAVVTVYQKLTGYDTIWSESVEVEYGQ